jgi:hypothetical protein
LVGTKPFYSKRAGLFIKISLKMSPMETFARGSIVKGKFSLVSKYSGPTILTPFISIG